MKKEDENNCISKGDLFEETKLNIDKFGLEVILVTSTNYSPSFAYSIGLTKTYNHPEIICFGLSNILVHEILNDVAEIINNGEIIKSGIIYTEIFKDSRATFLKVDKRNIRDYFGAGLNYYDDKSLMLYNLFGQTEMTSFLGKIILKKSFYSNNLCLTETPNLNLTKKKT